jgi:hypothetical protein
MSAAQPLSVPGHDGTGSDDPPSGIRPPAWYAWAVTAAFAGFAWICWSIGWLGLPVFAGGSVYLLVAMFIALEEIPPRPGRASGDRLRPSGKMRHLAACAHDRAALDSRRPSPVTPLVP